MTPAWQRLLTVFAFASVLWGCSAILGDFHATTGEDAGSSEDATGPATGDDGTTGDDGGIDASTLDATNQGDKAAMADTTSPSDATNQGDGGGACSGQATRCSGSGDVQTCGTNGVWGTPMPCPSSTPFCNGAGVCGVCADSSTQCSSNGGVQTCTAGAWGTAVLCTSGTCSMGACSGTCTPNESQCSGNGSLQRCGTTGVWGQPMACGTHQSCTGGGDAGPAMCACNVDPTCSGTGAACADSTTIASCGQDGQGCWYPASTSPCSNGACFGSAGSAQCCTNACTSGATQCGGAGLQTCVVQGNGCTGWNAGTACGAHQTCTTAGGSAACTCKVDSTCTAAGTICVGSATTVTCAVDSQNCIYEAGSSSCGTNQNCSGGMCVCNSGYTSCGSACVDIHTDNSNCGGCGKACPLLSSPNYGANCSNATCIGYVGGYVLASSGSLNANPDSMSVFAVKATMPGVAGTFQGLGGVMGSNDASGTTDAILGLYSDSSGQPGTLYFYTNNQDPNLTFNDPSPLHTATSGSGLFQNGFNNVLSANTSYWVYIKVGNTTGSIAGISSSPCMGAQWINVAPPGNFFAQGTRTCPGNIAAYMIVSFP